jgi:hypothetical protein
MGHALTLSLPSGLHRTDQIISLAERLRASGKPVEVRAYDTIQGLQWNGGRLMLNRSFVTDPVSPWHDSLTEHDLDEALARVQALNRAGIGLDLTFNNTLETLDTEDELGNWLLMKLHSPLNGVTVASESLRQHVSSHFPRYALTASICFVFTKLEQYTQACQRYDKVVMMPTWAYTPELLTSLPLEKLVFIVNDNCYLHCLRKDHYDYLSRCSLAGNSSAQEQQRNYPRAGCFLADPAYRERVARENDPARMAMIEGIRKEQLQAEGLGPEDMEHNFTITPAARQKLLDMGVTQFKLQGRDYADSSYQIKVIEFAEKIVREEL